MKRTPEQSRATKAKTKARVRRVAAAVVAGEPINKIAGSEKISRSWASAIANSNPVQQVIGELIRSESDLVSSLFTNSLQAIQDALQAERIGVVDKELRNMGADHYARLTAAKRLLEFVTAGRSNPKEDDGSSNKALTASEFRELLKEHATKTGKL